MTRSENEFWANVYTIKSIFGKPSRPEYTGLLKTKIKESKEGFQALVKFSFFRKWKNLKWRFYNQHPVRGLTKMRAETTNFKYFSRSYESAKELLVDYEKYRGSGITIW